MRSWPIAAGADVLLRSDTTPDKSKVIEEFLDYALHDSAADAGKLDYVPFPDAAAKQIEAFWAQTLHASP